MAELTPEDIIAQAWGLEDILAGYDAAQTEATRLTEADQGSHLGGCYRTNRAPVAIQGVRLCAPQSLSERDELLHLLLVCRTPAFRRG